MFEPGQRIEVRFAYDLEPMFTDEVQMDLDHNADMITPISLMKLLMITPINEARQFQPSSEHHFTLAEMIFGEQTKVLWLTDEVLWLTDENPVMVNGFPVLLLTDGRTFGIDGIELKLKILP